MTAPTLRSETPKRAGEARPYNPVTLFVYYPAGEGLVRGSVVLRSEEKAHYDYYTIRADANYTEVEEKLQSAVSHILRLYPSRSVRYMLKVGSRKDYAPVRARLDAVLQGLNLRGLGYGSYNDDFEKLEHIAAYAANAVEWEDIHNAQHLYISSVSNGEEHYSFVVSVTQRTVVWKKIKTGGFDGVAANLSALRDVLGSTNSSELAVWSNISLVNRVLRREKKLPLPKEAAATATELIQFTKSRKIGLSYNALHKPDLAKFSQFLGVLELNRMLGSALMESVQGGRKNAT